MKIYKEENLSNFEFWSGAVNNANLLTNEQMDAVEQILNEEYPDGMEYAEINDLFWFDFDAVCDWLGVSYGELTGEEEDEEEDDEEDEEEEE